MKILPTLFDKINHGAPCIVITGNENLSYLVTRYTLNPITNLPNNIPNFKNPHFINQLSPRMLPKLTSKQFAQQLPNMVHLT